MNVFLGFTFVLFVFFCWLIIFGRKISYYLYLWQVKEYRIDRMLVQLKEPFGLSLLFTRDFYVKIALAFILLVFSFQFPILFFLLLVLYVLEVLLVLYRTLQGKLKFPAITTKTTILFLLSFIFPLYLSPVIQSALSPERFIFFLLFADIFSPFIVTFWVTLFKPITYGAKQLIVLRAKVRRAKAKKLIAIGITGSFAKTSTKEMVASILTPHYKVAKTKEHQNTEVGAARAIMAMERDTEVLVAEMAAYRRGDISEISDVVKPTIGIITAIGPQHLALFGSMETIIETKFELATVLPSNGMLIVNWDNEYIRRKFQVSSFKFQVLKYSIEDKTTDLYASEINVHLEWLEFIVHYKKEKERFHANLLGKHNISNILAATAVALTVGMDLKDIARAVSSLSPLPRTMQLRKGTDGILFIDDTYNTSTGGVKAALEYLAIYEKKRRIIVIPSLIELGERGYTIHEELGQAIARVCDYAFVTDTKFKEALWRGWKSVKEDDANLHFHADPKRLAREVEGVITKQSVVLVEGRVPTEIMHFLARPLET